MEILGFIVGGLAVVIVSAAVLLVVAGFFPRFTEQERLIVEGSPGRALGVGLINLFFLGTIILTLGALGQNVAELFFIPAIALLAVLLAAALFGLAGLARLLGNRLWPAESQARQLAYSSAVLALSSLAPFVGWFGVLPLLIVVSLGLCVMTLVQRLQSGRPAGGEEKEIDPS